MAEQDPHTTDPDAAQRGAEDALLGDPDDAPGGPEERVSEMLDRESDDGGEDAA